MSGGWTWAIPKNAQNANAAWELIKMLTSKQGELEYDIKNVQIPVRTDVAKDPELRESEPDQRVLLQPRLDTIYRPAYSEYAKISLLIQQATEKVITKTRPRTRPRSSTTTASTDRRSRQDHHDLMAPPGPRSAPRRLPAAGPGGPCCAGYRSAPSVVLLVVFLAGPILYCIYAAFTNMALTGQVGTQFIGFANFTRAFTDPAFINSVWLTVVFTVVSAIIGQNVVGMVLALLMRSGYAVARALTSAFVIGAWVLPEVVAAYLWQAVLGPDGSWNTVTGFFHLPPQNWLFTTPIIAVSIANIWRGTAFSMLVYSAALSEVPRELEEAALVDGAGRFRLLTSITIPLVRRTIATNLMLITLQTLSVFGLIYTMTKGGPSEKSMTLPLFAYNQAFVSADLGYGTAIALLLLVIGGIFSVIYLRILSKSEPVR